MKVWKAWKSDGTANTVHHTDVTNEASKAWGAHGARVAKQMMDEFRTSERVTAVMANRVMERMTECSKMWGMA